MGSLTTATARQLPCTGARSRRSGLASRAIEGASDGRPDAELTALYRAHLTDVYRYVFRLCGDRALAEDVAQDAFLAVVRTAADPTEVSVGWLMRVARNRFIDIVRRETTYESKLRLLDPDEPTIDEGELVTEKMRVRAALRSLKDEHRIVLILHYVEGMTIRELAAELGRSEDAAESLIRRARRNLVRQLERVDA